MSRSRLAISGAVLAALIVLGGCARPDGSVAAGSAASSTDVGSLPATATADVSAAATAGSAPPPALSTAAASAGPGPATSSTGSAGATGTPIRATSRPLPGCTPATMATVVPGRLTFAADSLAAPWFDGTDPASHRGFEAAMAAAVAERLGFDPVHLTWITAGRSGVLAGTAAGFDAFLGQAAIPDQPSKTTQFSTGYLDDAPILLAEPGSPVAGVTTVAGLASYRIGTLGPATTPVLAGRPVVDRAAAIDQTRAGTLDGVIASVAAASDLIATGGLVPVGRIPAEAGAQPPQIGMVLGRSSTLGPCLSAAIDVLRVEGTLQALAAQWLPAAAAPELSGR